MRTTRPPDPREAYGRTVPAEAFDAAGVRAAERSPAPVVEGEQPELHGTEVWSRLAELGLAAARGREERFAVERILGMGSTGQVYAVLDRNLRRQIAVKVLNRDMANDAHGLASFIEEAQITAALKHPNVLPVLDIDITSGGRPFFSMSKIEGRTLGELIEQSTIDARHGAIASFNAVVSLVIAVCNAVAYAHHQRIVHQDIKPDNILIGEFGEVLVLDWGCAARLDEQRPPTIYGTPLYMSPEQARRERVDQASDVYCIGATLFHALTLRPPTWSDDPELFWRRKRAGDIDGPTSDERAQVPPELLGIALKALAADPAQRYASVEAMRLDLERYQSGLAISAHRYTLRQAAARWYRQHRRAVWTWSAVGAVMLALLATLYGERVKGIATWGRPIAAEDFADHSWAERWRAWDGGFIEDHGRLVSTGTQNLLMFTRKLSGPTAIEYDAEIPTGVWPGDISLLWARGLDPAKSSYDGLKQCLGAQIGAYDGSYTSITEMATQQSLAYDSFRPQFGQRYHVRVEIIGNRITLAVDGRLRCSYVDIFPLTGGYVGLMGYYKNKVFSNLRIYSLGTPEKVPATAIGDAFVDDQSYEQAAEQYARISITHGDKAIGLEARYKEGLCRFRLGERDRAFLTWQPLAGTSWEQLVRLHRLDLTAEAGVSDAMLADMESLYRVADADTRVRIATRWCAYCKPALDAVDRPALERLLAAHDRFLGEQRTADFRSGQILLKLGRCEELLARYPEQRYLCASALGDLDRRNEVVERYPEQRFPASFALFVSAHYTELERDYPENAYFVGAGMVENGRADEAMKRFPNDPYLIAYARLSSGRLEEVGGGLEGVDFQGEARFLLGRIDEANSPAWKAYHEGHYDEVIERYAANGSLAYLAKLTKAMDSAIAGDSAALRAIATAPARDGADLDSVLDANFVCTAAIERLTGDGKPLADACASWTGDMRSQWDWKQVPWHCSMYLLGRIDDRAYLGQPYRLRMHSWQLLLSGFREERAGHRDAALERYREWAALPAWERCLWSDHLRDHFIDWRIQTLSH
jgi:hypothetical protein